MDLSIIILNYNTRELLSQCLHSIYNSLFTISPKGEVRQRRHDSEIIVVDNGSTDGSIEEVKSLRLKVKGDNLKIIVNKENLGFAKGNNIGIKEAKGKYILLLNSDTVVEKETLPVMVKFMEENSRVGVATCRVELSAGRLDPACHRGFPSPWASLTYFSGLEKLFPKSKLFGQYHQTNKDLNTIHEIDSPTGAFYLVRREVVDKVGILDEDFFMYGEDLDWSYRIKKAGWQIMYVPDVKITHFKKQSGRQNISSDERRKATDYFYQTMKLFYQKHYQNKYPFFVNWLMIWGINLKWRLANLP
ncbi:MAG: glycosyltransferase family 2 protein [bacterium]|nr:glycosyltransferase family 2 protein [bacterium]